MEKLSIKNWSEDDRPREKLISKGLQSLSDAELIAILIGSGSMKESAVELSKRILQSCDNNLHQIGKLSINDLQKFHGIGPAKAVTIVAALELGRRRKISDVMQRKQIGSSKDAFEIFQPLLSDISHEEFWILLLNSANKVIETTKISQGGLSGTVVDIRIILSKAINKMAAAMIICHNHPSGNKAPSEADIKLTNKIQKACQYFDIRFLDHIIVADKDFYSFADDGAIK